MSRTTVSRIAWSIVALTAVMPVAILAVVIPDDSKVEGDLYVLVLVSVFLLVSAIVGALIASRQPSNPIGWLFCGFSALAAVTLPPSLLAEVAPARAVDGAGQIAAWLANWGYLWGVPPAIFVLLLFPDGRLPSRRWRWAARCGIVGTVVFGLGVALEPGPLSDYPEITSPVAIDDALASALERGGVILSFAAFAAAVASVVIRYRDAGDVARQQIKWLAAAALFAALCVVVGVAATLLGARPLGNGITVVGMAAIPVAIGVAMIRYRLYDVDRLISRSLTYAVVTATLAAAYAGLVLGGQALLSSLTAGSNLAIALSTLVVAALFLPLRSRVQRVVDRRFYRRRYDAQSTIAEFAAGLRREIDIDSLRHDLLVVVDDVMRPARSGLWLRRDG